MAPSLRPIEDVAFDLGLDQRSLVPQGRHKAKVELGAGTGVPGEGRLGTGAAACGEGLGTDTGRG